MSEMIPAQRLNILKYSKNPSRNKGSPAFFVGVLTLTPIHGAPPRWGIHSHPSPLGGRLEANKSKRGLERSQGPSPSPRLLGPKTATWPVRAHDLAITRILLQKEC